MTGYWMVPSAKVIPFNSLEFAVSRHEAPNKVGWNWIAASGMLPHVELAARYAMPSRGPGGDLSFNPKLGATLFQDTWHPSSLAVGAQDVWGGARLMHSTYLVATQGIGWLEGSVGWGNGASHVDTTSMGAGVKRLGGWFWAVQLEAPLPDSFPVGLALIHDDDATDARTGGRLSLRHGPATAHLAVVRDWSDHRWEWAGGLAWALPGARPEPQRDSLRWLRLRVGPWLQSFLGTEVGRMDLQAALEVTGIVQPVDDFLSFARLRERLFYTDNFEDRMAFSGFRQEPALWLEGAGLGWSPANRREKGLWVQAGVADGSWGGGALEASWAPWESGLFVGAMGGFWHSPEWHTEREVAMAWVDWESNDRGWWARADAGRYWNRDNGFRTRLGRRQGRLAPSVGAAWTDDVWQMDARLDIELDGLGWCPARRVSFEPPPVWGQGFMTTVARENGRGNPLRPTLGKDPALPLRGRYATWP